MTPVQALPEHCPHCHEGELKPLPAYLGWLGCEQCGRQYRPEQLEAIRKRAQAQVDHREILECLREDQRRGTRGGGGRSGKAKEDKLRFTTLAAWVDDSVAKRAWEQYSTRTHVIRIPGLKATSSEVRDALAWWFAKQEAIGQLMAWQRVSERLAERWMQITTGVT